jgi:hypothetical protein
MADSIEQAIERIANRSELRAWVDALPEDAEGLIVVMRQDEHGYEHHAYRYIGAITCAQANWLIDHFKNFMVSTYAPDTE